MTLAETCGCRLLYSSDQSLLLEFRDGTDRLLLTLDVIRAADLPGLVNLHPAYATILLVFDPVATTHAELAGRLLPLLEHAPERASHGPIRTVEIPVRYGGTDGPDLDWVAEHHGITPADVVELHSAADYEVRFLGFAPGFAYLSGLPAELATPRLDSPRTVVPAGSVGIAGAQTGVYPAASPGGWRLIGKTDLRMFDTSRDPMSLLEPGDRVRFLPI